ncbi:MAG: potassium channel family protein [Gammaproteobacteria bacterium]|nr:potassium channel family protein [Gammaproteobacteria bacterium]
MAKTTEKNNFVHLTIALVLLLFISAMADQIPGGLGQQLVQSATIITVAAGIASTKEDRAWFGTGVGFLLAIVIVAVMGLLFEHAGLDYLHLLILVGFYLYATWLAARQILFTGPINWNKIVGAICIYLLMGLIWALSYLFLAQAVPGAFNGLEQLPWYDNFADAAYYSFVTLTTLGYGDISPVAPIARFLVYMEAIFGVFYMAILVASLIGISTSTMRSGDNP